MFTRAYDKAAAFTRPLVTAIRTNDGKITTSIGAYVVVNGTWGVTAYRLEMGNTSVVLATDVERGDPDSDKPLHMCCDVKGSLQHFGEFV